LSSTGVDKGVQMGRLGIPIMRSLFSRSETGNLNCFPFYWFI